MIQGPFKSNRLQREARWFFQCVVNGLAFGTAFHIAVSAVYPNYFQLI